jgi:Domain of unknown function (DUF4190)
MSQSFSPAARRSEPLGIAALVCGILGMVGLFPASIGAIVCGHVAVARSRRTGGQGRGPAVAGLILGYIALALVVIGILIALLNSSPIR